MPRGGHSPGSGLNRSSARVESFPGEEGVSIHSTGFDASVEFVPEFGTVGFTVGPTGLRQLDRVLRKARIAARGYRVNNVFSYQTLARQALAKALPSFELFRCVTPSWDNSARRARPVP